jgi:hypothetical protein
VPISLDLRGSVSAVGWELPATLSVDEWLAAGQSLAKIERSVSWWLGDWWAYGEARYGERKALVEAETWHGPDFGTCANAASVCRKFETSRRRELLSFKHHAVLARLRPAEADALLDWCEETIPRTGKPRSTRELQREVLRRLADAVKIVEAPEEKRGGVIAEVAEEEPQPLTKTIVVERPGCRRTRLSLGVNLMISSEKSAPKTRGSPPVCGLRPSKMSTSLSSRIGSGTTPQPSHPCRR